MASDSLVPREASGPIADRLAELRAGKIEIHVKAVGSTPTLRQPRFTIDGTKRFGELVAFLKGALKVDTLHVYCCDAFEPAHDEYINDLWRCFKTGNRLSINYASEPAFS
mmetsp:Transcript_91009/g.257108  ORF Transcript_91009/g.257108 Transcript_91009/m.257108 type:complete len:110 (-) Transcript_91009:113-442(-)